VRLPSAIARAAALGIWLGLAACAAPSSPSTVVYGLTLAPSGIDPHINASDELGIPLSSVYDTLIFRDPQTGAYVPGLAERWMISDDGLTYTFWLRQDVHFHDGTPFNAQSVKRNFDYTLNPDNHSQRAALSLGPLREVTVDSANQVSLHLDSPYAPLLDSLSQVYLGMASAKALDQWGAADYQYHQVGTGPYRFVEYVPNDHLTLERNADYQWGPSIYQHTKASIQRIIFRFYEDPATRALALESGQADVMGEMPPRDAQRLLAEGGYNLQPVAIPGQPLQLLFNLHNPPTDELQVRQALIMALDRPAIVDTVFGSYSPVASSLLSAATPGFNPDHPFPAYDPTDASRLLDQSGWRIGSDGLRQRQGVPLQIKLVVPTWGSNPEVAQLVQAAWQKMGAQVQLNVAPGFGPLKQAQQAGDYNAIGYNTFGTDPDLLQPFFFSNGLYNWSGVRDAQVDELLTHAARLGAESPERHALYARLAAMAQQQAWLVPIRDYVDLVVSKSSIKGLRFSFQGWFPLLIDLQLNS
jgi:peptide/nickel transport system substrate-binding protein